MPKPPARTPISSSLNENIKTILNSSTSSVTNVIKVKGPCHPEFNYIYQKMISKHTQQQKQLKRQLLALNKKQVELQEEEQETLEEEVLKEQRLIGDTYQNNQNGVQQDQEEDDYQPGVEAGPHVSHLNNFAKQFFFLQ